MDQKLNKNILFTLAYFGALGMPMTAFELWRLLFDYQKEGKGWCLTEILAALSSQELKPHIFQKNGFITLKDDGHLIGRRIATNKIAAGKLKRFQKWARIVGRLPFVRGLLATGTLASGQTTPGSDWDVITVLAKKRIWVGRFLVAAFLQLCGKRRHGSRLKDRFCLNHFFGGEWFNYGRAK